MAIKTPFFEAFGPLLFGRAPSKAVDKLGRIDALEDLYNLFGDLIPDRLLGRAESGVGSHDRSLPGRVTFWAFVAQVLSPGMGCREVVSKVQAWWRWAQVNADRSLSAAAYCQARKRLDTQTLELIAGQVAWSLERNPLEAEKWLGGRPVKIIDGTSVSMPDTPENQSLWPQPSSQKPGCGFPLMKLVGLFSLSSGALLDHATANEHVHESQLFRQMWPRLRRGDVLLGDRAFAPTRRSPLWPRAASMEFFVGTKRARSISAKTAGSVPMIDSSSGPSHQKLPPASATRSLPPCRRPCPCA